jgi:D-alanyl-D-alanine carboxypeptidase
MTFTTRQLADAADLIDPVLRLGTIYARVPGIAFGLTHEATDVLLGSYGLADVERDVPVDVETTRFRCASITKSFTATLIMRLVERRKLRLDDAVSSILPWVRGAIGDDVTVRHLLSHSAGMIRDGSNAWDDRTMPDRTKFRAEMRQAATFAQPAERFRYSNTAYSLLGEIIERASGHSFEAALMREIARPLQMRSTTADLTPAARRQLAIGYYAARPTEHRAPAAHVEARAVAPAGGLVSTVPDLLTYQRAHLPGDPSLLSELSKREMQRTQFQRGEEPHYGLGWANWTVDGIKVVGHSGGFPGFITKIGFAPSEGVAATVLTNANSPYAGVGLQAIYHVLSQVRARWKEAEASTRWHSRGSLRPFVGLYRERGYDVLVARINGSLYVIDGESPAALAQPDRLVPRGPRRFLIADGEDFGNVGEEVVFNLDRRGQVSSLAIGGFVLERVAF